MVPDVKLTDRVLWGVLYNFILFVPQATRVGIFIYVSISRTCYQWSFSLYQSLHEANFKFYKDQEQCKKVVLDKMKIYLLFSQEQNIIPGDLRKK